MIAKVCGMIIDVASCVVLCCDHAENDACLSRDHGHVSSYLLMLRTHALSELDEERAARLRSGTAS